MPMSCFTILRKASRNHSANKLWDFVLFTLNRFQLRTHQLGFKSCIEGNYNQSLGQRLSRFSIILCWWRVDSRGQAEKLYQISSDNLQESKEAWKSEAFSIENQNKIMTEGQIIVPIIIVLGVGILVGTRIWMMFRK